MADHCVHCGHTLLKTRIHHRYVESGLSFVILANCIALKCTNCKDEMPVLPNADSLILSVVENIVRQPFRLHHEAVRYLRRAMGFNMEEFAVLLGTTRVEVSRWENGRTRISGLTDLRLRREVVDKLLPPRSDRALLLEEIAHVMTKKYDARAKQKDIVIDAGPFYGRYVAPTTTETAMTATK